MIELKEEKVLEHIADKIIEYTPSKSGFNGNRVFLSDTTVIKIFKESEYAYYDNEMLVYEYLKNDGCVAKIIETGMINTSKYIKMERINATALYNVWHLLDKEKREELIQQIAKILNIINSIPAKKIEFKKYIVNEFNKYYNQLNVSENLKDRIYKFYNSNIDKIQENEDVYLTYFDAHFDNFMYNEKENKIYAIDFEDIRIGALDYQLDIINRMCKYPYLFANEEDEKNVKIEDYKDILNILKKNYPKMFENEYLEKRLQLYSLIYDIYIIVKYKLNEEELLYRIEDDLRD